MLANPLAVTFPLTTRLGEKEFKGEPILEPDNERLTLFPIQFNSVSLWDSFLLVFVEWRNLLFRTRDAPILLYEMPFTKLFIPFYHIIHHYQIQ